MQYHYPAGRTIRGASYRKALAGREDGMVRLFH